MPLSELQVQLTEVMRSVPGAQEFVLVGGGALAVLGIGDRGTNDLDWFARHPAAVDGFAPDFALACVAAGLEVREILAEAGFHRFEVSNGREATVVDLAWDARLRPPQETPYGQVLDRDELAADKLLALFNRAAPRDFVDVYRLRDFYSREQLCALAREKDRGFTTLVLVEMLAKLDWYERREFAVDDKTFSALRHEFRDWSRGLTSNPEPLRPAGIRAVDHS